MKINYLNLKIFLQSILLMVAVFLLEINTGILAGTVAYIMIVLYVLWFSKTDKYLIPLGIISSVLIVVGYFFSTEKVMTNQSIMLNRSLTLLGVWLAVYIAIRYKNIFNKERKLKEQLRALFENATEGIVFIDNNGHVILTNPFAAKMFGYEMGELIGENIKSVIPEKAGISIVEYINEFLSQPLDRRNVADLDMKATTKNGKEFPVAVTLTRYNSFRQDTVIAFIQDVTSEKERERLIEENLSNFRKYNAELEGQVIIRTRELKEALFNLQTINSDLLVEVDERKKIERQLRKSQQLYSEMARNFPEGIIGVLDRDMRYLFAEGEDLLKFGYKDGNVKGRHIFDDIGGHSLSEYENLLEHVYNGEKVKFDIEIESRAYSITAVPLTIDSSEVNEALVVIRNITHRKKVEKDLVKTLEKERELNMLKSRFVTTASHEFRTPLTTILSSASLLENYVGEQYDVKKPVHLKRIKRAVHGLTELLNEFLSLGKLEEGMIKPVYTLVNIREMAEELISEMELLRKENQKINFSFNGNFDSISIDKQLLHNVLINLLSNAIKYSPPSSEIELDIEITQNQLKMKVRDHGIGIPEAEHSHIFKRFFRAKNAVEIEGTGLGLNIVKKYVKLLKGNIHFKSKADCGSTFMVTIPLIEKEQTALIK